MSKKIKDSLEKLETALERLNEALAEDSSDTLVIDGTIQRFEFVFELAWKTLKRALNADGIACQTPRETLKAAYKVNWINDEEFWVQMLDDRNLTSHTYDEPTAQDIYANIQGYYSEIVKLAGFIRGKYPLAKDENRVESKE